MATSNKLNELIETALQEAAGALDQALESIRKKLQGDETLFDEVVWPIVLNYLRREKQERTTKAKKEKQPWEVNFDVDTYIEQRIVSSLSEIMAAVKLSDQERESFVDPLRQRILLRWWEKIADKLPNDSSRARDVLFEKEIQILLDASISEELKESHERLKQTRNAKKGG